MDILLYLIPIALVMGGLWLSGFMWALKKGQFDDPEGAAARILLDDRLKNDSQLQDPAPTDPDQHPLSPPPR